MAKIKYSPDYSGIPEIAIGAKVQAECLTAAQRGATWANQQDPGGRYEARAATVTGGRKDELRGGAVVEQTESSGGAEKRVLLRAVNVIEQA